MWQRCRSLSFSLARLRRVHTTAASSRHVRDDVADLCAPLSSRASSAHTTASASAASVSPSRTVRGGSVTRERLHLQLSALAHAVAALPARESAPSMQTAVTRSQVIKSDGVSPAYSTEGSGTGKTEDGVRARAEAFTSPRVSAAHEDGAQLKRLLVAKREAQRQHLAHRTARAGPRPDRSAVVPSTLSSSSGGMPADAAEAPVGSAQTHTAAWQEALRLFVEAVHDHAVTPTAQHFNLLLQLTTHDEAWHAVDHVEAYYARFLASVCELRAKREMDTAQQHRAVLAHEEEARHEDSGESREEDEQDDPAVTSTPSSPDGVLGSYAQQQRARVAQQETLRDLDSAVEALRPNSRTFHALMRGALARRRWPLVLEYVETMQDFGLVLSDETLQLALEALLLAVAAGSTSTMDVSGAWYTAPRRTDIRTSDEGSDERTAEARGSLYENVSASPSSLRAVLRATQRAVESAPAHNSGRQRLTTSQRGPHLRAAARPTPSPAERAQAARRREQEAQTARQGLTSAEAAFRLVRDYSHLVSHPRTVWLLLAVLRSAHSPECTRRMVEVYQLFSHMLRTSQPLLPHHGEHVSATHICLLPPLSELSFSGALATVSAAHANPGRCAWVPPPPVPSSTTLAPKALATATAPDRPWVVWCWMVVSAAARDVGDWVVAKEVWQSAVHTWDRHMLTGPTFSQASVEGWGGKATTHNAERAYWRQSFLEDVVQPLLVNHLHALRRVRRYADMLVLYQQQYAPVWEEVETHTDGHALPLEALIGERRWHASASSWSTAALVLVAQAATALQRMDVLRTLIRAEAALVSAHVSGAPKVSYVVPLPADVYESALRTQQVQSILRQQGAESGNEGNVAHHPSDVSAEAERIYAAYLAAARHQCYLRDDTPLVGSPHGYPLLTTEHEPLLRALFALRPASTTATSMSEPISEADIDQHTALWRSAMAHFNTVRRPDALHMALMSDIFCTAVQDLQRSTHPLNSLVSHEVASGLVAEAASRLLADLTSGLSPDVGVDSAALSSHASAAAAWRADSSSPSQARLTARLACAHVSEVAMTRLLTGLILSGEPYLVLVKLPLVSAMVWLSEEAAASLRQQAQQEAFRQTRAGLLRARHEEQQLTFLAQPTNAPPMSRADDVHTTVATGISDARAHPGDDVISSAVSHPSPVRHHADAGHATLLLTVLASREEEMHGDALSLAARSLLLSAITLIQLLQRPTSAAAPAFDSVLIDAMAVLRAMPPSSATSSSGSSTAVDSDLVRVSLVLPAVVDAILEQVMITTPSRCTLWPHCLRLVMLTLSSPFRQALAPSSQTSTGRTVQVSPATLPLLTRFIRYCDRAESDFVARVVVDWLRPSALLRHHRVIARESPLAVDPLLVQGWELALEALVWACRHREKSLAKRIYAMLNDMGDPTPAPHRTTPLDEVALPTRFPGDTLRAQLSLVQCLTSGGHEDVLDDWVHVRGLMLHLTCAAAKGAEAWQWTAPGWTRDRHSAVCGLSSCAEVISLTDALVAVCVKLQKTLHYLLTRIALDAHRQRVAAHALHTGVRRNSSSGGVVDVGAVEAMAQDFIGLLGPVHRSIKTGADEFAPPSHGHAVMDVLTTLTVQPPSPTVAASVRHAQALALHRTLTRALQVGWDVLYTEYVWLSCFKHGEASSDDRTYHGHFVRLPTSTQRRLADRVDRMTQLLQIEVEFCVTPRSRPDEGAWDTLREHLLHWSVVTACTTTIKFGNDTAARTASTVARVCNHLTALDAVLGARAVTAVVSSTIDKTHPDGPKPTALVTPTAETVSVLFLDVVRDVTSSVLSAVTVPAPATSPVSPGSLPLCRDGTPALSRFQSPASLLNARCEPLSLLHDAALQLLYVALCEESVSQAAVLHPALCRPGQRECQGKRRQPVACESALPFAQAGLLPSALTWCGGVATARYADILRACAALTPHLAAAQCLEESHGTVQGEAAAEWREVMAVVFDHMAALRGWQRGKGDHTTPLASHAELLVATLMSVPRNHFGETVRVDRSLLSEPMAASALFALSFTVTPWAPLAITTHNNSGNNSNSSLAQVAAQQAERLIRAFPQVVVRECLPRWLSGLLSSEQIAAMDGLFAHLWVRESRAGSTHRAALAWSFVVHGGWPTDTALVAADTKRGLVMAGSAGEDVAQVWSSVLRTGADGRLLLHPAVDLTALTLEVCGGLKEPLERFLASSRGPRRTTRAERTGFIWANWEGGLCHRRSAHLDANKRGSEAMSAAVAGGAETEAVRRGTQRAKACLTASAAIQLLDLAFPPTDVAAPVETVSSEEGTASTSVASAQSPLSVLIDAAGDALTPVRKAAILQHHYRHRRRDARDGVMRQLGDHTCSSTPSRPPDESRRGAFPVVVLVRAVVEAAVTAARADGSSERSSLDVRELLAITHDTAKRLAREGCSDEAAFGACVATITDALDDFGCVCRALTAAALSDAREAHDAGAQVLDVALTVQEIEAIQWCLQTAERLLVESRADQTSSDLLALLHTLLTVLSLAGAPAGLIPQWLWQTYTALYRPRLRWPSKQATDAWTRFIVHHTRTLFFADVSREQVFGGSTRDGMCSQEAWAALLHLLALDLVGLELSTAHSTACSQCLTDARTALVEVHARLTSCLDLPRRLQGSAVSSSEWRHSGVNARSWAIVSILLGTWREPLHVFKSLAGVARLHSDTMARKEACGVLSAVALLMLCADSGRRSLAPSVLHELVSELRQLDVSASLQHEGRLDPAGEAAVPPNADQDTEAVAELRHAVSVGVGAVLALHKRMHSHSASSATQRAVLLAPLRHVVAVTDSCTELQSLFFHLFIGDVVGDKATEAVRRAWLALKTHGGPPAVTPTSLPPAGWAKVQSAVQVLREASDDTLRAFVRSESRSRRSSSKPVSSTTQEQAAATAAVRHAWTALATGLAEAALVTADEDGASAHKSTTTRAEVLDVLTSSSLAAIPHSIHFIPVSLSEALINTVCQTWQDAVQLLRFSLSTLRKTNGRPTAVQQYMALLILQRVRQDQLFSQQLDACHAQLPDCLAGSRGQVDVGAAEPPALTGGAALAALCFRLVAAPHSDSAVMTPASAVLPQRVLSEVLRHAATDLALTQCLYRALWQQPYARLEGPHAFLSLLRAARLHQRGDVGLQAMVDFLAAVGVHQRTAAGLPSPCAEVVAWQARVGSSHFSAEAHRVVWRAFARLCEARLLPPATMQEVLERFRTTGALSDVDELLVTVLIRSPEKPTTR